MGQCSNPHCSSFVPCVVTEVVHSSTLEQMAALVVAVALVQLVVMALEFLGLKKFVIMMNFKVVATSQLLNSVAMRPRSVLLDAQSQNVDRLNGK